MLKLAFAIAALAFAPALWAKSPPPKQSAKKPAAAKGRAPSAQATLKTGNRAAALDGETSPAPTRASAQETPAVGDYRACMDDVCLSPMQPDRGRCRCSGNLVRIEKVLRDIEKSQNEADKLQKELEILMNVANSSIIKDALGNTYDNIAAIEKKAKMAASNRIDGSSGVMEGLPLYEHADKSCAPEIAALPEAERGAKVKEYSTLVESDCAAYATVLKEKADSVASLLTQVQKNREMFFATEDKKRNQLSLSACKAEYEACIKSECGLNFKACLEEHRQDAAVNKCEAANRGKCEDSKDVVRADMKSFISLELRKADLIVSCRQSHGWVENGRCLFKCITPKGGGDLAETMSAYKDLSCSGYLLGPDGEKAGNSASAPKGWAPDGYPSEKELRGAF